MAEPSKITMYNWSQYLGGENTFHITRYDSNVLHTIKYRTGELVNDGIAICELSSATTVSFTLPVSLASANTTGTSVRVIFDIDCYLDGEKFHSTSVAHIFSIPEDVKPSCDVSVTDANGLLAKYGAYVQNKSKLRIVATPTLAYESPIAEYKIAADGMVYNLSDVVTEKITSEGEIPISATVTDARGRSASTSASVSAIAYTPPAVVSFTSERVNSDGSDNEQGDHIKVTFSAVVTSLNNKNSAVYKLEYKKSADSFYTEISVSDQNGKYSPADISRIFEADTGSSYNVRLTITDDFHTTVYENKAQSGFTIFHVPASGRGFSFGKVSEIDGLFDVAFLARFLGGFMQPELDAGTDFDNVTVPNTYAGADAATSGYINCPFTSGEFVLDVKSTGGGGIVQCAVSCEVDKLMICYRRSVGNAWGVWISAGDASSNSDFPKKDTLENMSWADISKVCRAGKASEYWKVGDKKELLIKNYPYNVILIGFDHDNVTDSAAYGRLKAGATFMLEEMFSGNYKMIDTNTNKGGWPDSTMRNTTLSDVITWLDEEAQAVIVPIDKISSVTGSAKTTSDSLFFMSEKEVFNTNDHSYTGEGTQYAYYAAGNSKIKYKTGTARAWWLRSQSVASDLYYCYVTAAGAIARSNGYSNEYGLSFNFCV